MPTLVDRIGPIPDPWAWFDDGSQSGGEPAASSGSHQAGSQLILSLDQWSSHGEALLARGAGVGICLEPADDPARVGGLLDRITLIAVRFPEFTDGRGYSCARLLRQRYGWSGELRAVGDVLRDQMFYLSRCGFSTFELKDGESVADALAGLRDFSESYQAAADRGPLFARRATPAATLAPPPG